MSNSAPYAELFVPELEHIATARERAIDVDCTPVSAGAGAALALLAASVGATNVVEIGTGTGVSGLHLLAGMPRNGVLTTIDIDADHQRAAKEAFRDAGITAGRVRLIGGRALDVLPRLTDAGYDLAFLDGAAQEYPLYIDQARRLLRTGGIVVIGHALADGSVLDPTDHDPDTVAVRDAGKAVREDEDFTAAFLPLGDGLIAAVKR